MTLFQHTSFYTSVNHLRDLPKHNGLEVAFAGRSNAGKSSAINTLTHQNRLAHVSKTPGRTQQINFFQVDTDHFLVDLPGYGYAKVPLTIRQHWENLLSNYLQTRKVLEGLVLIMDVRHPLKALDLQMLDWFASTRKSVHVLLTKSDKLSRQVARNVLRDVQNFLQQSYPNSSAQLFSSMTGSGVEEARAIISGWLGLHSSIQSKNMNFRG